MAETVVRKYEVMEKINKMEGDLNDAKHDIAEATYSKCDLRTEALTIATAVATKCCCCILQSTTAIDTSDTGCAIYVLITNTGATDLGTVGSAVNAADAVADNSKALVELSNWTDVGGARVCTKGNIGLVMKASSTSKNLKFGVVNVSGGDIVIGSGEDIIFHFGVVKD